MVTPTIPLQATTSYMPQNPVGTPSHQRMKNPVIQQNPTVGQVPIGGQSSVSGQIPTEGKPSFSGKIPTGGKPSFSGKINWGKPPFTGQIPVVTQPMEGGQFQTSFSETRNSPGDHPREDLLINHIREDLQIPTHRRNPKSQSFWTIFWTTLPRCPESHLGSSRPIILSSPGSNHLPSSGSTWLPSLGETWLPTSRSS
jgi:hypothetical protein